MTGAAAEVTPPAATAAAPGRGPAVASSDREAIAAAAV